ncbi:MAG: class I SAM-dependent methyltransferase [Chloroflexi bacterium]|nr:class I SAM-dependent methyltransferase [Chloroflexota bacterium]
MTQIQTLSSSLLDYSLLDSGNGRKLERFADMVLIRPEERATWRPTMPGDMWRSAQAEFREGKGWIWREGERRRQTWEMTFESIRFTCEIGDSKQVGVFPENAMQWKWIQQVMRESPAAGTILNLFGYTGIASLVAAREGGEVTHVDSSRRALRIAKSNQILSGLGDRRIRWLVDDAQKFVQREIRRGRKYHGLILDPPVYGKGPKNESWQFSADMLNLCQACRTILEPQSSFIVLTAYGLNQPPSFLEQYLDALVPIDQGKAEFSELAIPEADGERRLNIAISARWTAWAKV